MEKEEYVRVRLVGGKETPKGKPMHFQKPGTIITAFGHDFTVQPNLELEADMHMDYVPQEVAAGRVFIVNQDSEKKHQITKEKATPSIEEPKMTIGADPSEVDDDGFSMDMETYFGTGSIDMLKRRLEKLVKEKVIEFIATRFNIKLSQGMKKEKMVEEAIMIVKAAKGDE